MKRLSIAIAVFNEAENLRMSMPALRDFADEIIVVDGGSTDDTVSVAKSFGATVVRTTNPPIFHINKQKALDACTGTWIFQLDADEKVTEELKKEIMDIVKTARPEYAGYYVARKNYFLGHWMRKGGQYPDYVIRLFIRGKGSFPAKSVHEQISIDGKVGYLSHPLLHYSYRSFAEYMLKANRYSDLEAQKMIEQGIRPSVFLYVRYNTMLPLLTFLNLFVRHKGFVDGMHGLLYAVLSGMQHAMAYAKMLKLRKKN